MHEYYVHGPRYRGKPKKRLKGIQETRPTSTSVKHGA